MASTVRVGAVDCGTNSIRLLVADVDPSSGALRDVTRRMSIVRLGHGVDRTGLLDPQALTRTLDAARTYAGECRTLGATAVRFVATSAARDARNASEFVTGVREAFTGFDVVPEVVSGDEEARLSFLGATGDLAGADVSGPYLVVDIGGGSTELVRGEHGVEAAVSVDIGSVRMTERHLHSDPPSPVEVAAAARDIDAGIDVGARAVDFRPVRTLVGLAGSITTVAACMLGLPAYHSEVIHLARGTPSRFRTAARDLLAMPRAKRAALGFMHPGRADVIGGGALIWDRVIDRVCRDTGLGEALPVLVSEHDILDGMARSLVSS